LKTEKVSNVPVDLGQDGVVLVSEDPPRRKVALRVPRRRGRPLKRRGSSRRQRAQRLRSLKRLRPLKRRRTSRRKAAHGHASLHLGLKIF
jgi:hypothetical protein